MLKFIAIAIIFQTCNCQLLLNNGLTGLSGLTDYRLGGQLLSLSPQSLGGQVFLLQPVQQQLALAPLARPALSIRAPQPVVIQQAAPRPILLQSVPVPKPLVIQPAPRPVVIQPAPRPVAVAVEDNGPAEPYNYGYQTQDEEGNTVTRQETSDGSGTVRGSYSYTDTQGLNRIVEYIADADGYRATVKTNEPGTANANPADVQITASDPPAEVVARYINPVKRVQ